MTPMIDVIFLLLVFFVCTANFMPMEAMLPMDTAFSGGVDADMNLPDLTNLDIVEVQIFFDGKPHWQIAGNRCSALYEVQSILKAIQHVKPDIPVVIEPADGVPMENVIDIYDICRRVGLLQVQFSAEEHP